MNWLTLKAALYACAALGALWLGTWGVMALRLADARMGESNARHDLVAYKAELAEQRQKFEQAAREAEQRHAQALNDVAGKYEQEKRNAQAMADRLVSDLRAGTVRLRRQWQGCEASARVSATGPGPRQPDAGPADRAESASRIVRAAADCDAQVRALQAIVRADRTLGEQ